MSDEIDARTPQERAADEYLAEVDAAQAGNGAKRKASAGWYAHPSMADTQRYWDGEKWTDNIAPAVPTNISAKTADKKPANEALLKKIAWGIGLMFVLPVVGITLLNSPNYGGEDCGTWMSARWDQSEIDLESTGVGALGKARIQTIANSCNEALSDQRTICLILLGVGLGARIGIPPIVSAIRE